MNHNQLLKSHERPLKKGKIYFEGSMNDTGIKKKFKTGFKGITNSKFCKVLRHRGLVGTGHMLMESTSRLCICKKNDKIKPSFLSLLIRLTYDFDQLCESTSCFLVSLYLLPILSLCNPTEPEHPH